MKKLVVFATVLASAAAAIAQSPGPTRRVGPDNDPTKIVCQRFLETGSLTRRTRVCKTRAEWDAMRRENREHVEKVQQYKPGFGQ